MRFRKGLLAVLLAAAFPASAMAAPDKTSELSADLPKFEWTGEGTGVPIDALGLLGHDSPVGCDTALHDCDFILLDVKHPGTVKINAAADGAQAQETPVIGLSYPDIDVYFYKSDKDGVPQGDSLTGTDCATGAVAEACEAKGLEPGLYVVEVSFFLAEASTYKASAELLTAVPPTPPGAPAAPPAEQPSPQPQPQPQPGPAQSQQQSPPAQPHNADEPKPAAKKKKTSKKAACKKKAKKIKNRGKRKKALRRCARVKG